MRRKTLTFAVPALATVIGVAELKSAHATEINSGQGAPSLPNRADGTPAAADAESAAAPGQGTAPTEGFAEEEEPWRLLEQRLEELEMRLQDAETQRRNDIPPLTINGYVDLGFFAPLGNNGVGWVRDVGSRQFPDLSGYGWTFLGDILGSPINSRGEAADLGDAPGADRFDSVNSDGAPGFIANELNLRLGYTLADNAIMRASLNFVPRSATRDFEVGDFLEVDLAEVEYILTEDGGTSLFAGKILPVFGIEYKDRKSDGRFGITPSLVARYTTGPQLGVKIRSKLLNEQLILAASVTNNTSTVEQFDFHREIDRNVGKTLNGRVAFSLPLDAIFGLLGDRLELGLSGEWGAQDNDIRSNKEFWLVGADLQYLGTDITVKAQIMKGEAPGTVDESVWTLELKESGYVEADWQAFSQLGLLLRVGLRDAFVSLGSERAYVTKQVRYTGGIRWLLGPHIMAKAEYLHNSELGSIESFGNDMFTTSLILSY